MIFPLPKREEFRSLLALAAPIMLMHLGMMLYGVVDTLFMGRVGAQAVAGVGLAHSFYITIFLFGLGSLLGIDTLSSRAHGAGQPKVCAAVLVHALALALAVALPLFGVLHLGGPFWDLVGVDPVVARAARDYLHILKWMMFPALLFTACRHYLQTMDITRPLLVAIVCGNALNVALDYGFIFGRLGLPAMGMEGCAVASVATTTLMFVLAAAAAGMRVRASGFKFQGWHVAVFRDLIRLGMPAGFQLLIEVSSFTLVTAFMGRFGAEATAAHQITFNLAGLAFMVPLGMSAAAAVRVGQWLGRGDPERAAGAGDAALISGALFMGCVGVVFWTAPAFLIRLYTPEVGVIALGASLLRIGALFQVFDGAQIVLTGALRGLGETRLPMVANLLGHAVVGIPLGYFLAFHRGGGPHGLWIGLLVGLGCVAGSLFFLWRRESYLRISSSSTSKTSVDLAGIVGGRPRSP